MLTIVSQTLEGASTSAPARDSPECVLVVEPDGVIRNLLAELLDLPGRPVVAVASFDEALVAASKRTITAAVIERQIRELPPEERRELRDKLSRFRALPPE